MLRTLICVTDVSERLADHCYWVGNTGPFMEREIIFELWGIGAAAQMR